MKKAILILSAFLMMASAKANVTETVVYSDDFNRTELSDATHTYTSQGQASIVSNNLKMVCPKDGSNGRNYAVGKIGMRANLTNVDADSVVWLVSMRQNYDKGTSVLSGFDEGKRGIATVLLMNGTDPLTADGYALTYGGTGQQQYCLVRFAGGLSAQANMTPIVSGPASTNDNKNYWSLRVVYKKAAAEWVLYQNISNKFPTDSITSWTYCGQAVDSAYITTPIKQFGFLQNYTGSTDFNMQVDNFSMTLVKGDSEDPYPNQIDIKKDYGSSWATYPVTTTYNLKNFTPRENGRDAWSKYGSYRYIRTDSTGYFHVEKIDGRWWLIDPDGYAGINRAVTSVPSDNVQYDYNLIGRAGFHAIGNWGGPEATRDLYNVNNYATWGYTRYINFHINYKAQRQTIYPEFTTPDGNYVYVLDPKFEQYCKDLVITSVQPYAAERDLMGWFTDNEIPFNDDQLQFLVTKLDPLDPSRVAALEWALEKGVDEATITKGKAPYNVKMEFGVYLAERYFTIVEQAIRSVDTVHMILGSRLHGRARTTAGIIKASHDHSDITSVNFYDRYSPTEQITGDDFTMDHPCLVTEFYTKDVNYMAAMQSGAGWYVKTQADRGRWYENTCIELLASKCYVGWQYFRYMDNTDSNKGMVTLDRQEYTDMTRLMRELNEQVYTLCDYYDGVVRDTTLGMKTSQVAVTAIKDNATSQTVAVRNSSSGSESAMLQFALPEDNGQIRHAVLRVNVASTDNKKHHLLFSAVNGMTDINNDKQRIAFDIDTITAGWHEYDVTTYLSEQNPDSLTIRIHALMATDTEVTFHSTKASDVSLRPQLLITYLDKTPTGIREVQSASADIPCKIVENGQVVIIKNNKKYNILGMPL